MFSCTRDTLLLCYYSFLFKSKTIWFLNDNNKYFEVWCNLNVNKENNYKLREEYVVHRKKLKNK